MPDRADTLALVAPYSVSRGTVEAFSIPTPGVGAAATRTVGQGYWERYQSIVCQLVTSAAVANRVIVVQVFDADGNRLALAATDIAVAASSTAIAGFYIGGGVPTVQLGGRLTSGLPNIFLQQSWQIQVNAVALDAGDQFSAIRGIVERFGIGPDGTPVGETTIPYTERGRGYTRSLESE